MEPQLMGQNRRLHFFGDHHVGLLYPPKGGW